MHIAIIGAGQVGRTLGDAFARVGHAVCYGTRDPARAAARLPEPGRASLLPTAEAIEDADLCVLALPYAAALSVASGVADWGNRVLVDVTNPLAPGLAGLTVGTTSSSAEQIARQARRARVVKAFNTTGVENMANPRYGDARVCMPVCGDDDEARGRVLALAADIGFEPLDCGTLSAARYLEPFAMTWIHLALRMGQGRQFGFGVLRR